MIKLFGCPLHYGANNSGLITSLNYLKDYNPCLDIDIIPEITLNELKNEPKLKNLYSVVANCQNIANYTYQIVKNKDFPLFIGGDHAASIGTISATSTYYQNMGLIWIDAHADINTFETTNSGNIHGMPVASLLGLGEKSLTNILNDNIKINKNNLVYLGLRDVEPKELALIKRLGIRYYSYQDIQKIGLKQCLIDTYAYLNKCDFIHLSFDLDAMNPNVMPAVSVSVKNGFSNEDIYFIFDYLLNTKKIKAIDIVEYNQKYDLDEKSIRFINQFILYLINKIS